MFTIIITYSKLFQSGTERRLQLANLGLGEGLKGAKSCAAECCDGVGS